MTDVDQRLDLARTRDLQGRRTHPWIRRALLMVVSIPILLALTGTSGQPTRTLTVAGTAAHLQIDVPDALRGGLLWRARIALRATRRFDHPRIVLGAGFLEGMQVNTIEPSPTSEASRGPNVVLSYDTLDAGDELVVYLQLQVNPTTIGTQDTSVEVNDETTPIARIAHTIRVLP
jgi:hypothetical protein